MAAFGENFELLGDLGVMVDEEVAHRGVAPSR